MGARRDTRQENGQVNRPITANPKHQPPAIQTRLGHMKPGHHTKFANALFAAQRSRQAE